MRPGALLLALLLLAPGALAAGTHETEARLSLQGGLRMRGEVELAGDGLLEMRGAPVEVRFGRLAEGWVVHRWRDTAHVGLPGADKPAVSSAEHDNRTLPSMDAGRVENVRCGPYCMVAVYSLPGEGAVGVAGFLDGALAPQAHPREVNTTVLQERESQFRYRLPAGHLALDATAGPALRPWTPGRVGLVLRDASFDIVSGSSRQTIDARSDEETRHAAAGRSLLLRNHTRHAVLVLEDAAFALAPGTTFRASFPQAAEAPLDGMLVAPHATGGLIVGGEHHEPRHDRLLLEGRMTASLFAEGPAGMDAEIAGQATRVVISGADVTPRISAQAAAGVGAGVVALLALALVARLVLVPLYHRLGPRDVLKNENRRRIYEEVRARPGVGVADLVASVGLSRILVRHHLRMLEAHKLVRATRWRRRRTYAAAGEDAGRAACELKDATRRKVAAALVRSGRATQKDLVGALGLSQRLVSYHLARLESAGLVRIEGKNPRSYVPTEELVDAVEKEEGKGEGAAAGIARATAA